MSFNLYKQIRIWNEPRSKATRRAIVYQRGKHFATVVNVLPGVAWSGGRSPSCEVTELRSARCWRRRLLRWSSSAGPWISGFVAGVTDICQVNVGSSLCFFGGRWRRRRWWWWWWTSCTTRTVAHGCLPQSLPAQLGEHTASPMAVALTDHPSSSLTSSSVPSFTKFERTRTRTFNSVLGVFVGYVSPILATCFQRRHPRHLLLGNP